MTDKLDPTAWAETGDTDLDERDGVQEVDAQMIFDYVTDENVNLLPTYSAQPFARWLDDNWINFTESTNGLRTNGDVITGALINWCGGRTG